MEELGHLGAESSDAGLASVLDSLEFCLKLRGSEASVLEDLSRAINLVHTRRNLVENNRVLLNHAHRVQQEYERYEFLYFIVRFFLLEELILAIIILHNVLEYFYYQRLKLQ